jgi:hypothetical protein
MIKLRIDIETENASACAQEVVDILADIAADITLGTQLHSTVRDTNGNAIGHVDFEYTSAKRVRFEKGNFGCYRVVNVDDKSDYIEVGGCNLCDLAYAFGCSYGGDFSVDDAEHYLDQHIGDVVDDFPGGYLT